MRGKRGLAGGKRVEREEEKNVAFVRHPPIMLEMSKTYSMNLQIIASH